MKCLDGWIADLWCFDIAWQGNVDLVRNLCGQLVEVQRRDEADHRPRHAQADLYQVRVPQRLGLLEPVNALSLAHEFTPLDHFVENVLWHAQPDRRGCAQDTIVIGKYFFILDRSVSSHKVIIQQKYHTFVKIWYSRFTQIFGAAEANKKTIALFWCTQLFLYSNKAQRIERRKQR